MRLHFNTLRFLFSTKKKFCGQLFIFVSYCYPFLGVIQSGQDLTSATLCYVLHVHVNSFLVLKRKPSKEAQEVEQD